MSAAVDVPLPRYNGAVILSRVVNGIAGALDRASGMQVGKAWDDPELEAVLPDIAGGRLEPGLDLVKAAGRDWNLRAVRIDVLSEQACAHLDALGLLADRDADGLLWLGAARIRAAWRIRGAAYARHVGQERFERFRRVLETAAEPLLRAAELDPDDPVPWDLLQWHALGLDAGREELDHLWMELWSRDSHLVSGHLSRLQVLCPKWRGSPQELFTFARETVRFAAPGDPRGALVAIAHFENIAGLLGDAAEPPATLFRGYYSHPDVAVEISQTADRWLEERSTHSQAAVAAHFLGAAAYYGGDTNLARRLLADAGRKVPDWSPWALTGWSTGHTYARARRELGL